MLLLLAVLAATAAADPYDEVELDDDGARRPIASDWFDDGVTVEPPLPRADALARIARRAPPIGEVVAASYRASGLDHDPGPGWQRRARFAALVPAVSVHDGRDATWHDVGSPTITNISLFSVTATWRLERLVYEPTEMHVAAFEATRRRERRRLAKLTIRSYYRWLRARADAEVDGRWASRADEAAAELDALSDGWFGKALARAGGSR